MAYERVNWENLPSKNTPVNATNLNKMDVGIANAVKKSDLLNLIYPVGSIYISVNSTNPANLFGGTWEQIKDRFLLACGSTYNAGATGGEATHRLTQDEMPNHKHARIMGLSDSQVLHFVSSAGKTSLQASVITNTGNTNADFDGEASTSYTGGGQAHNNMPPYLAVFMWKRIS